MRTTDARRFRVPAGARLLGVAGRTLGGALLADYRTGTLRYRELIVFSGLAASPRGPGFVVSHLYVDSEASLEGGRAIWGLPKELAEFTVTRTRFEARQGERVLFRADLRGRAGRVPLAFPAPALGERDGRPALAAGLARVRAAPALARLHIPATSPFAALGLAGTRPALRGDALDLIMPPPR